MGGKRHLQWISAYFGHAGYQVSRWEILKYVAKLLITFVSLPTTLQPLKQSWHLRCQKKL